MYSVGEFMTKIDDLLVVKTSSTVDEGETLELQYIIIIIIL